MKNIGCMAGAAFLMALLASGAQARTDGQEAVGRVGERLRAIDCAGAVKALNAGLGAGYPEVALLAGNLVEMGLCLKKDWGKAMHFYSLAEEGGLKEGAYRLAAGFAAAANGPDMAAALWWARRAGLEAGHCTADLPKTEDVDRFVAALGAWPAGKLAACNYVVGMLSFVVADTRYPLAGVSREIQGRVEVTYGPALSRFQTDAVDATGPARRGLGEVIARSAHLAAARYPKPAVIDPAWEIPFVLLVDIDKSRWW